MANEIVKSDVVSNLDDLQRVARLLAASTYFEKGGDVAVAQIATKVLAGREMGFAPFASVNGIHIIQGKPTVSANLMASAVKRSARYDYRVRKMEEAVCTLEFFERTPKGLESLGVSTFTAEDAKKAGTQNVQKFARNMLFARAMSNGVRWYCPDVFDGSAVYTPEEMGAAVDGDGEIVESAARTVDTSTGEIIEPAPAAVEPPSLTNTPAFKRMHALGREVLGEDWRNGTGRELLKSVTGKESTKLLSAEEISAVIEALEAMRPEPLEAVQAKAEMPF